MRYIIILFVSLTSLTFTSVYGQAGLNIYAGPSTMFSQDNIYTPSGSAHFGYVAGANVRLNSDPMYFLISGEFGGFDFIANKKFSYIGGDDLTYSKFKIGLGFDVYTLAPKTYIRTKLQGTILLVSNVDDKLFKTPSLLNNGYIKINDGIAGLCTSIGFVKKSLTIDLEYEQGFFNLFSEKKESKINFLNLVFGVRF
jgi:hypothetical protein